MMHLTLHGDPSVCVSVCVSFSLSVSLSVSLLLACLPLPLRDGCSLLPLLQFVGAVAVAVIYSLSLYCCFPFLYMPYTGALSTQFKYV